LDEELDSTGGTGEGKLLGCDPALGVGDPTIATGVVRHCLDFTASDLVSEQPTEVVVATTTPTMPRVKRVTSVMAMTRR